MALSTRAKAARSAREDAAREYVDELIRLHGVRRASRLIGISAEALARLHGRLPVLVGTVAHVLDHQRASAPVRAPSTPPASRAG